MADVFIIEVSPTETAKILAQTAATTATTKATEAAQSATDAETAQTAAETAQSEAETSATQANEYATAAATSETNAATSETNAAASAVEAAANANTVYFLTKSAMDADLAHDAGTQAKVTNDTTNDGYYTKTGASGAGEWTLQTDPFPISDGVIEPVKTTFFTSRNSVNIYNLATAVNGKYVKYSDGTQSTLATGAIMGKTAVEAGKTYTLSLPSTEIGFTAQLCCYNASNVYLGTSRAAGGSPGIPAGVTDSGAIRTENGRYQYTFTLSEECLVAKIDTTIVFPYTTHTTEDFDRIKASLQLEEGTTFTEFEAYGAVFYNLDDENAPAGYEGALSDISTLQQSLSGINSAQLTVVKTDNNITLTTPWSSIESLVQTLELVSTENLNETVDFEAISVKNNALGTLTQVKTCTDDTCPAYYNGTYLGAHHGALKVLSVTAAGHGKTIEDRGSEWTDGASTKWYIVKVVDVDTLLMMSENLTPLDDVWTFDTSISGTTLTHSADATHTDAITLSAQALTQLWPALKNQSRKMLLNGILEITANGTYTGDYLLITNSYDVYNPSSLLDYLIANVGSSEEPDYEDVSIVSDMRFSIAYRFSDNGSCTVQHSFQTYSREVELGYLGGVQSMAVTAPSGGTTHFYVPRTTAIDGYDLQAVADISSLAASLYCTPTEFTDANNPPERVIQFAKTSGGDKNYNFGFTLGYNPDIGGGNPTIRKDAIEHAFFISNAKKMYPKFAGPSTTYSSGIIPANSVIDVVAFRCPVNYNLDADATNVSWYYVGNTVYVMLDYHTNVDKVLYLSDKFINKAVTVVNKSDSFTLKSSFVTPDGIGIKVTDDYGYAVLKLT